jgi:hypothetical protein
MLVEKQDTFSDLYFKIVEYLYSEQYPEFNEIEPKENITEN